MDSGLDARVLSAALGPRWRRVEVIAETGSTNADLLADHDAPDRSVLVAESQTAARGRLDRTWTSAPGTGLTFSALLRPGAPIATWGWLPLLTGVALQEAVAGAGVEAALKWPNDLLAVPIAPPAATPPAATPSLPGVPPLAPSSPSPARWGSRLTVGAVPDWRKVAGILAQTSGEAVVIGIGLNVSTAADDLPVETATSLALSGGTGIDRGELLVAILTRLDARVAQWEDVGGDAEACGLAAAYRDVCATLGQQVSVTETGGGAAAVAGRTITGTATGIDQDGRLVIATDSGEVVVGAGDVQHLRPSSG